MPESAILPPKQPLINRRLYKRGIIAAIVILIVAGLLYVVNTVRDFDFPAKADTKGDIAAIRISNEGQQAVLIKPDGTVVPSPNYHPGIHDRDPVWRPDGNRVFFTSDRDAGQINLYRWNPGSNKVERRTATSNSYTNLMYSSGDPASGQGLVTSGGMIVQFDPVTGDTTPILPPALKDTGASNSENGRVGSIEGSYFSSYGTSFKEASW